MESALNLESNQGTEEYNNAFITLQRKQTDEMNDLRRLLQMKSEHMYRI